MDGIDDNEELEYTEDAFKVLGFGEQVKIISLFATYIIIGNFILQEKFDCYMLTAGVMSWGGVEFKTKGRDDQASHLLSEKFTFGNLILDIHAEHEVINSG